MWDVSVGRELQQLTGHTGTVSAACFNDDGTQIASGGRDKTVRAPGGPGSPET